MTSDTEDWSEVLERAEDYNGSGRPEGLYIPAGDVVNVLNDIEDPRHKALGYTIDELTEGYGWGKYPEEGRIQREELEGFIADLDGIKHPDAPSSIIEELTPTIEATPQHPYLEEEGDMISVPSARGKTQVGDEISAMNKPVESIIVDYLEERRYEENFIDESKLKKDLKPIAGVGFLFNSPLSMRNSQVREISQPYNRQDLRDRAINQAIWSLKKPGLIASDSSSDEESYRSQLNPVQRGLYSKVNPENGDYEVLMTGRDTARIIPSEF